MDKIKKFEYKVLFNSDDNKNIEEQLSIFDTLPKVVSWHYNNKNYKIDNEHKIIAMLLEKENLIAIIEAPYDTVFNKAYIIDGTGKKVMDISSLFKKEYNSLFYNKSVIFSDIYYINKVLYLFLVSNNTDFRVEVDINKGFVGGLIESR